MSIWPEHLVCLKRYTLHCGARPLSGRRLARIVRHEVVVNGVVRTLEAMNLVMVIGGCRLRRLGGGRDRRRERGDESERHNCRCPHFTLPRESARGWQCRHEPTSHNPFPRQCNEAMNWSLRETQPCAERPSEASG